MNSATKTLVFLAVLVAAALGVGYIMTQGHDAPPTVTQPTKPETEAPAKDPPAATMQAETVAATPPETGRTEVLTAASGDDLRQGIKGRIVDPTGNALAGTPVFLMEGTGMDLFRQLMLANKGVRIPPVARDETDEQGYFELGVEKPDPNKRYEVRIVSDRFVDHTVPSLTVHEGEWYDTGLIRLENGAIVWGRVTIEGSNGLPVPDAKVMVQGGTGGNFPAVSPTPGREDGLVVECDPSGSYRIENVPPGIVQVAAVAPGYARIEKQNTTVDANNPTQVDFLLPAGVGIAGFVSDARGHPVAGARVEATAISAKTPATGNARSDRDGHFEIIGLVDAPYSLSAIAPGYVRTEVKPVQASDKDVSIVLEKQGAARIRAYDQNGRFLRRFQITVKRYMEGQDQYGQTDVPTQQARVDQAGIARIEGIDPGQYVFQVEASGLSKAFSDPFKVTAGGDEPLVEVRMNEGGKIEGQVVDSHGAPVQGMTVTTLPNHVDENPFTKMFEPLIPYKITRTQTRTDAQGRYKLSLLTPGPYQLKFSDKDYSDIHLKDIEVREGETTTVPPTTVDRGTIVEGTVNVSGGPGAQVKVSLSAVTDPASPTPSMFSADAMTDNEGHFQFDKRIPPGRYQVMAARQTLPNPLLQIADFHKTKQEITIGRGQDQYSLQISITDQ